MNKNLRTHIVSHLLDKGMYSPDVDDPIIDMLMENIKFSEDCTAYIAANGLFITMLNGNGFETTKENPAFGTYVKCIQNIHQLSTKLGINRKDRLHLKLLEEKTKDDFDNDFGKIR